MIILQSSIILFSITSSGEENFAVFFFELQSFLGNLNDRLFSETLEQTLLIRLKLVINRQVY